MGKVQPASLPQDLALQVPRAEAQRQLRELITRGEALTRRRTPADLRVDTDGARELTSTFRQWGREGPEITNACLGPEAAQVLRALPMRYTTLDLAKEAVRRRLALLKEALGRVGQLRKTARKAPDSPSRPATEKKRPGRPADAAGRPFHFCLSFAGEDRKYAQKLHRLLTKRGMRVFYDNAEKPDLWGRNLYEHLADIYEHKAHFCVMFASRHYVRGQRQAVAGLVTSLRRHRAQMCPLDELA